MRQILIILLLTIQIIGCVDQSKSNTETSDTTLDKIDSTKSLFVDSGVAKFEILSGENSGYDYQTIETTYERVFLNLDGELKHYFAKYLTTTKTCTGCEGQERNISIELNLFDNPTKTVRTINKNCDALTLDTDTYKTVVYGCCSEVDQFEVYDYESRPIIEGDSKIVLGEIPNSPVEFLVAYKQETSDSTTLGTVHFSYNASDRYAIKIKSNPLPEDHCSLFTPEISIQTNDPKDKYSETTNEYTFWSLNDIANQSEVNNLTITVVYDCKTELNFKPINIPIIGGKPFVRDARNQELIFRAD